eukprot:7379557-Prymnesium_polylepis.3
MSSRRPWKPHLLARAALGRRTPCAMRPPRVGLLHAAARLARPYTCRARSQGAAARSLLLPAPRGLSQLSRPTIAETALSRHALQEQRLQATPSR